MTDLPSHKGARVVAHTTDNPTRRAFECDGNVCLPWVDVDRQDAPSPLWRDSTVLLGPVPVPYNPQTGKHLHYVPADATIPAGATYYWTPSDRLFYGPCEPGEPHTPTRRATHNTYWTVEPIPDPEPEPEPIPEPEPEKAAPALVGWWDVLTDDHRIAYTVLDAEQACDLAELLPRAPIRDTRIADEGLTPVLHDLTSGDRGTVQGAIADLVAAWLGGDM